MKITYVCNCCGRKNIDPEKMTQHAYRDRTLHACEHCKGIEVQHFVAKGSYDTIEQSKRPFQVSKFPKCDICQAEAHYDSKTVYGAWAYLCPECNEAIGMAPDSELCTTLQLMQEAK